jgi:hypothetical protein
MTDGIGNGSAPPLPEHVSRRTPGRCGSWPPPTGRAGLWPGRRGNRGTRVRRPGSLCPPRLNADPALAHHDGIGAPAAALGQQNRGPLSARAARAARGWAILQATQ